MIQLLAVLPLLLSPQQEMTVTIFEDVGVYWEDVTFKVRPGKHSLPITLSASATMRGDSAFLSRLRVTTARHEIQCSPALYGDLPFPQLGTIAISYSSETTEPRQSFTLRFAYGQTPYQEKGHGYVQVELAVVNYSCTSRQFLLPDGSGHWVSQKAKP